ncbi:MAG TPA: hypothetical protein VKB77_16235 [Terriglobales bacterium]|nr:hypothetical protein [Terriglobales bacterium]
MNREKALKDVLVLGLLFLAAIYPLAVSVHDGWRPNHEDALPKMLSLYVTLRVFLLLLAAWPG